MQPLFEKYRMFFSYIIAVMAIFFMFTTKSYWEGRHYIVTFLLFLSGILCVAIASMGRMWCSLYIAGYKDNTLITQGPYSLCRNPLYFFSMIGFLGIGLATETFTFPLVFLSFFFPYYRYVMRCERERLAKHFGAAYEAYAHKTPLFFPSFTNFVEPKEYIVKPNIYRKHIFSALWFVWIVGILEFIEGMKELHLIRPWWTIY